MKYFDVPIFNITIHGADGREYSWLVAAADWQAMESMIKAAGIDATVAGKHGAIIKGIEEATAQEITDVLNEISASADVVKH